MTAQGDEGLTGITVHPIAARMVKNRKKKQHTSCQK